MFVAAGAVLAFAQEKPAPNEIAVPGGKVVNYEPITPKDRVKWFAWMTIGPASITGGLISSAFGTALDNPKEYGPHWEGFGERFGMRFTGVATSNAMEAGLGALWGEDPRYFRAPLEPFGSRIIHVVKWTFVATDRNGHAAPAYARYMAISGSNFLSNTWREPSEADTGHALDRIALGFVGRMASNAWQEFWPDINQRVFHHHPPHVPGG